MTGKKENITILIVDDNETDLQILADILLHLDCQNIVKSTSAVEALRLAEELRPDLDISDIMMPCMDGGQMRECLKENSGTKGIPTIFLTSAITKKEEKTFGGKLVSGDLLLAKPFSVDEISKAIDLALGS